jgi:hypothetical protein
MTQALHTSQLAGKNNCIWTSINLPFVVVMDVFQQLIRGQGQISIFETG